MLKKDHWFDSIFVFLVSTVRNTLDGQDVAISCDHIVILNWVAPVFDYLRLKDKEKMSANIVDCPPIESQIVSR